MPRRLLPQFRLAWPHVAAGLTAVVLPLASSGSPARAALGNAFFESLGERAEEAFDELDRSLPSKRRAPAKPTTPPPSAPAAAPAPARPVTPTTPAPAPALPGPSTSGVPTPAPAPQPPRTEPTPGHGARILQLVNEARARGGNCGGQRFEPAPALTGNGLLDRAAQGHAEAMARDRFFDHTDPQGRTPRQRITATGYAGTAWGENIAAGQPTPDAVVQAWLKSPGHCKNIHSPMFDQLGVGALLGVEGPYKSYWVQNFGKAR